MIRTIIAWCLAHTIVLAFVWLVVSFVVALFLAKLLARNSVG